MRRRKKIRSKQRNIAILVISLLLIFVVDNAFLSLAEFFDRCLQEYPSAKQLSVWSVFIEDDPGGIDREAYAQFESYLQSNEDVASYVKEYENARLGFSVDGTALDEKRMKVFDYEVMKDYILTEGCGMPEGNEILIGKYLFVRATGFGSEARGDILDGEALVGKTITGTVSCEATGGPLELDGKEFTVIGVYDNRAMGEDSWILLDSDTLWALHEEAKSKSDFVPEENDIYLIQDYGYQVTMKSREACLELMEHIDTEYINPEIGGSRLCWLNRCSLTEDVVKGYRILTAIVDFLLAFFLVNTVINIVYTEENKIFTRRKEYGLMKAVGYRNRQISMILLKETAGDAAVMLALIFGGGAGVICVINRLVRVLLNVFYYNFQVAIHANVAWLVAVTGIVSLGIGYGVGAYQLSRLQATEALKSEE